jgi:ketosteroid isomerase-like protein
MKRHLQVIAACTMIGAAVPVLALAQQNEISEKDRKLVEAVARKYEAAYNAKDVAGIVALHTEDAIRVRPEGIVQGRSAIQKDIEGQFKAGGHDLSIGITVLRSSGNVSWGAGDFSVKYGDQLTKGHWANVFVRSGNDMKI